jgi:hypothetical protein
LFKSFEGANVPISVVIAATLQLLLAATFVVMLVAYSFYGPHAQRAAEAEVVRQGFRPEVLAEHGVKFKETAGEAAVGYGIAATLATLAWLNLAGSGTGQILSWIVEPIVLIGVGYITAIQVMAGRFTEAAFKKSTDLRVRDLDAKAVFSVASDALPSWFRPVTIFRFGLTTLGSLGVIVLLVTPAANVYFN